MEMVQAYVLASFIGDDAINICSLRNEDNPSDEPIIAMHGDKEKVVDLKEDFQKDSDKDYKILRVQFPTGLVLKRELDLVNYLEILGVEDEF